MTKRTWVKVSLASAVLSLVLVAVAVESGWLVRLMDTPSDWEPQPMSGLQMRCGQARAPIGFRYCVHRTPGSTSRDLLVHFHGRRGTQRWWNDRTYYTGELYEHWERMDEPPPTVVSISFGPLWLLVGDTRAAFDGVFERARDEASAWAGHDFDRHLLVGESMGGYNALIAGLDGGDRFERVAALCPPLSTRSPFGRGVLARARASGLREAFMLLSFSRAFFDDEAHWRNVDPLARITAGEPFEPRLHMTCGEHDPWGCIDGGQTIADALVAAGDTPQWLRLPEGHCAIDSEQLAEFLSGSRAETRTD